MLMNCIRGILDRRFEVQREKYEDLFRGIIVHFDALVSAQVKKSYIGKCTNRYKLILSSAREIGRRAPYPAIYFETHLGFILCVLEGAETIPVAAIGFEKKGRHLVVRQVQGMKGAKEYLRPLHWEQLLYRAVILFGRSLKLETIQVFPAQRSDYHPANNADAHEELPLKECWARAQRMHLIYDIAPAKCGFTWDNRARAHLFELSH